MLFAKIDNVAVESHDFLLRVVFCLRDKPFRFMKRWHQWLPALNCPCGIPYFSFFDMSRAFSLTSDGKMARPLFRFSVIHSRSISSSGHVAFLPRFASFNQGMFSKFSLLFRHKRMLISDTPNSLSAARFPCCSAKLTICNLSDTV